MFLVRGSWFLACRAGGASRRVENQAPRTKNILRSALAAACLAISITVSNPALGQDETIFDPENPAVQGVEADEEESDDGEETIFDPENPAVSGESESGESGREGAPREGDAVELAAPRLKPIEPDEARRSNAAFLGTYASSLGVDTAWEGRDEDIVEWTNELELRLEFDMPGQSLSLIHI